MKILDKAKSVIRKVLSKRRITSGVIVLALAGVLAAAGVAGHPHIGFAADAPKECDDNTIMRCGADGPEDFIAHVRANTAGVNGDLPTVYAHFGLKTEADYNDFAANAKQGTLFRDGGRIEVDGQTVATDGTTMGRKDFGNNSQLPIGGTTYFFGTPDQRWKDGVESLPVMVWFDKEGTVITAILNPCGNPVPTMKRVKSGAECKDLVKHPVAGKKNTFTFTTDATKFGLAQYVKFEYFIDEGNGPQLFATTKSPDAPTPEKTFTKDATVTVKITISLPGDKQRVITSEACSKEIKVEKEKKEEVKVVTVKTVTTPPAALPVTGPEGLAGLFAGVSAVGAAGHHLYVRRNRRKSQQ